jgi:crotonobetainyl-CoA hydratase
MTDSSSPLTAALEAGVLTLTINRPEARNSVNLAVATELGRALERAASDRAVRVVILTGAGSAAFCAGADLKAVERGEPIRPDDPVAQAWGFAGYVAHVIDKPTIAAVNGAAIGGGLELVLASDLAVASATATFGLPEVRHGIFAAAGGAFRLPTQIPRKIALEMILTGEPITAERARELGLVNSVVPADELLEVASQMARRIASMSAKAVQAAKRVATGIVDSAIPSESAQWALSASEWEALRNRRPDASTPPA